MCLSWRRLPRGGDARARAAGRPTAGGRNRSGREGTAPPCCAAGLSSTGGSDPTEEGGFDDRHRDGPRDLPRPGRRDDGANPGPRGSRASRHAASQTGRQTRIT